MIAPVLKTIDWSAKAELSRSKLRFDTPDEALGLAQDFLQTVRDESGILTGWDQDHYGFMHLGFQEYLTAIEIRNKAFEENQAIWQDLAAKFGESWWQEVFLLLVALDNPSVFQPLMREVLKRPVFATNLDLVEMCLDDAAKKSLQPFCELIRLEAGQDQDLWNRQFLTLQLVARIDARVVEELLPTLRTHPSPRIRQWLRERSLRAKQTVIAAERGGYELVYIPSGVFIMGSEEYDNEKPPHEVQLADFYIGRYPITNEEYGRFLADNPDMEEPKYWGDRRYNQPNQPVVGVSWFEAQQYAQWAGLSLPTEAQWEYACRAGTTSRYYTGDSKSDLDRAGWYSGNSGGKLHPVGEKEPNAFGLYDMHGNVWEWCLDWYDKNYYSKSPREDPEGPDSGSDRVFRGGGWCLIAGLCRAARRNHYSPDFRDSYLGFRLLRTPS